MGQQLVFSPFRLDLDSGCLFQEEEPISLRPQNFAVLQYLATQAPRVVTTDELLKKIWKTYNAKAGPKQCVSQLRQRLGDSPATPRFIRTVGRTGYQFIAAIGYEETSVANAAQLNGRVAEADGLPFAPFPSPRPRFVGRSAELAQLHTYFAQAQQGERQLVLIGGEPGIGKTALVDAFLAQLPRTSDLWVSHGQCIEHYGEGEAYLPVLEALGRWVRYVEPTRLLAFLTRYAPAWLVQLPSLVADSTSLSFLQRSAQGATQQRMLREFVEAVEALTMGATECGAPTLVLVLEDLHWSDYSTFELLTTFARRREKARVLIIGTYRPAEGLQTHHPFRTMRQELHGQRLCREVSLAPLDEKAVIRYLEQRFPASALPDHLALALHRHTGGNPFFLEAVVDDMIDRSTLTQVEGRWVLQSDPDTVIADAPNTIRHLVSNQMERLPQQDRSILEAASLAGLEFSAATVAAVLDLGTATIEQCCSDLADRHYFVQKSGRSAWPDGTEAEQYSFRHSIYRALWQNRTGVTQQQRFHLKIAERHESAYGKQTGKIAPELALHFEKGRDYARAIRYLYQAASNALQRSASREAITLLTKGRQLLATLPDAPTRVQQELDLQVLLGSALMIAHGFGAPEAAHAYARARELCRQVGDTPRLFSVLRGLGRFYMLRADYPAAREIGEQQLELARTLDMQDRLLEGHQQLAHVFFHTGDSRLAWQHLEQALAIYDPQQHSSHGSFYGQDARVTCLALAPLALWTLGYPDQALERCRQAIELGRSLDYPHSLAFALSFAASFFYYRREVAAVRQQTEDLITLATTQDFPLWLAQGKFWQGWVLSEQGEQSDGIEHMRAALDAWRETGAELGAPFQRSCLALALHRAGRREEGLAVLDDALASLHNSGEEFWAAEVYRLKGVLLLETRPSPTKKKGPGGVPARQQKARAPRSRSARRSRQ
ncbi:MAG: AAA family ATPase [Deltaproteobacteria bacterium]|nr:AAA family ATPase [Deltaproteobacteria bacterium]